MKRKLLLAMLCIVSALSFKANAQGWTASEVADGDYYLYNVGAQGFLEKGACWGSHATIQNNGTLVTLTKVSDGVYTIATPYYHGSTHWFADNAYMDSNETSWTFETVPGLQNTYKLKTGGNYAYVETGLYNVMVGSDTGNSKSYWKLVTAANRLVDNSVATTSNPLDVSYLITNARFDSNTTGWTGNCVRGGNVTNKDSHTESDWNTHNPCLERWHATTNFYQDLTGLKNGKYIVKCQGFYRADDKSEAPSYLYANSTQNAQVALNLKKGTGDPNTMSQASNHFSNWEYMNHVTAYVTDGNLRIGIKTDDGNNWTIWDNFQLFYCGNDMTSKITNPGFDDGTTGWTGAGAVSNSEVEYWGGNDAQKTFDLYQDLTGLEAGIYAVEAQSFYRNGSDIDVKRAKAQEELLASLYAKGEDGVERSTTLLSIYEEAGKVSAYGSLFGDIPNWMNQAQDFISAGYYGDNKVLVEVGDGGTLRIGAKKSTAVAYDWTILDNFTLTKLSYATLAEAYAAEWTARKATATALLTDKTIHASSTQRSALETAVAATPSDVASYVSALADLRTAVNNYKAAYYAYDQYATSSAEATDVYNAEATTYKNITGEEKTTYNTAYSTYVTGFSPSPNNAENYYNAEVALKDAISAFKGVLNNYNEYAAEVETASLLGTDISGVSTPTTSAAALTAAHTINVLNYAKVVAEEYEDVSGSTLGDWTDYNVTSRRGQHWDGTTDDKKGTEYFEMASGWGDTSWNMSRSQSVSLSAGKYILKVACRVSPSANATLSVTVGASTISTISGHQGDSGLGITTSGEGCYISHDVDDSKIYANGNNGRGFEWKYIPFELAETGTATLAFTAEGHARYQYVSFTSLALLTDPKVAARTTLLNKINESNTEYNSGANVGSGIFQVPAAAGTTFSAAITTAQGVYDNGSATKDELTSATSTLNTALATYKSTTLNAPSSGTRYKLTLADRGALSYNESGAADEGGYGLPFSAAADYKAQTFFLTQQSGNNYKLSFVDFDGETRYICTGENAKEGLGNAKIRTTTDASKALVIEVSATPTANVFNMLNTSDSNNKIGSNGGGMYTANDYASWSIAEASKATVPVKIQANKYGTIIFPFTPDVSAGFDGITFYTCSEKTSEGDGVKIEPLTEDPVANTPYIVRNANGTEFNLNIKDWGTATDDSYDAGYLTGIYTAAEIPVGSYVLQTQSGVQGFYQVKDDPLTGVAYRAYLTVPAASAKSLMIVVPGQATDVTAPDVVETEEPEVLYNLAGIPVGKDFKGVVINQKGEKRLQNK